MVMAASKNFESFQGISLKHCPSNLGVYSIPCNEALIPRKKSRLKYFQV